MTSERGVDDPNEAVSQRQQVKDGYDELAADYADNWGQSPQERALVDELASRIRGPERRVLDAGCGDGRAASRPLAERGVAVVGLDVSRSQLELATETLGGSAGGASPDVDAATPRPALAQGDLTALPFETGTVDGICALHSIIHVPRDEHATVYEEFARVLDSGGWLLLTTGVGAWKGRNPDWLDSGAEMRWSFHGAERTRELLADAGFTVADERTVDDEMDDGEWQYVLARRN